MRWKSQRVHFALIVFKESSGFPNAQETQEKIPSTIKKCKIGAGDVLFRIMGTCPLWPLEEQVHDFTLTHGICVQVHGMQFSNIRNNFPERRRLLGVVSMIELLVACMAFLMLEED
jgi:hypothetical protein